MKKWTIPNLLTFGRILLIPVFSYFFLKGDYRLALGIFVLTGFTDIIDGWLARTLHQRSTLGAILDPSADKLLMLVTFIILAWTGLVPWWLSALVIARDLAIITGVLTLKHLKKKLYFKPTKLSKLNTFFQLSTIFLAFLLAFLRVDAPHLVRVLATIQPLLKVWCYLTGGMTVLSWIQYTRIGLMILRGRRDYADLPLKKTQGRDQ